MSPPSLDAVARGDIEISRKKRCELDGDPFSFSSPFVGYGGGVQEERALHSISFLEIASKFRGRGRLV